MAARQPRRAATMREVATLASVDISTVSKVLKGDGISVRPETRDRIMGAVAKLGYRPNQHARGLRLQRTGAIGLLLPDITDPVYASIVRGAVKRADERGYSVLLAETPDEATADAYRMLVQDKRIDGLLVATARRSDKVSTWLANDGIPHVFVNRRPSTSALTVVADDEAGAALAARAMIERGHHDLGMVAGPADVDPAERRLDGFRAEIKRQGLKPPVVKRGPFTPEGGRQAMSQLLAVSRRPTAVLVSTFVGAIGALRAINEAGLRAPDDISIVSFDDPVTAGFLTPSLTCVAMPFEEMGRTAVDVITELIEGGPGRSVVVDPAPRLVVRESLRSIG